MPSQESIATSARKSTAASRQKPVAGRGTGRASSGQLTPHEQFRKFLQDGQYRITPERFEVLEAVLQWDDHFDADNLFIYLKNNDSKVSRATVYKTLNLLHECGLVSRYRFSQGHAQYEKTTDRPHHDHMVCTKCGKIIEFENSRVVRLQDDACAVYGFKPTYHSFQIFGVCLECSASPLASSTREHAVQDHVSHNAAHHTHSSNGTSAIGGSSNGRSTQRKSRS